MSDATGFGTSRTFVSTIVLSVLVTAHMVPTSVTCNISLAPVITIHGVPRLGMLWKMWACEVI